MTQSRVEGEEEKHKPNCKGRLEALKRENEEKRRASMITGTWPPFVFLRREYGFGKEHNGFC